MIFCKGVVNIEVDFEVGGVDLNWGMILPWYWNRKDMGRWIEGTR